MTSRRKYNVVAHCGIFSSDISERKRTFACRCLRERFASSRSTHYSKTTVYVQEDFHGFQTIMSPVYEEWFLTYLKV